MAKSTKITLDGNDYSVPQLSIEQLEELTDMMSVPLTEGVAGGANKRAFSMFKVLTKDMTPKPDGALRATADEVRAAITAVLETAGLKQAGENPPSAAVAPPQS